MRASAFSRPNQRPALIRALRLMEKIAMKSPFRIVACVVTAIEVASPTMAQPQAPQGDIDLTDYDLTWTDGFNGAKLNFTDGYRHTPFVSDTSVAWIDHTPWGGDFGDAAFVGTAFSMSGGFLNIKAWRDPATGKWSSGLLSSVDGNGNGFKQQYGYFEARMKVPGGLGTWPAFWLGGYPANPRAEIDVVEFYGGSPTTFHQNVHVWDRGKQTSAAADHISDVAPLDLTHDFHIYGVTIFRDFITFYLDGVQQYQVATPTDANQPVGVLVNYALGSGWGESGVGDPSYLVIDWVRVYKHK